VSAYAASHPWEDWAETWAHYLHMTDCLDTAVASGVVLRAQTRGGVLARGRATVGSDEFEILTRNWMALTCVLNNLNRSMGQPDAYPFALPSPALAKLRFVHEVVTGYEAEELLQPVDDQPLLPAALKLPTPDRAFATA
jgi:hypothetical protein